jgi:hypothetical protein
MLNVVNTTSKNIQEKIRQWSEMIRIEWSGFDSRRRQIFLCARVFIPALRPIHLPTHRAAGILSSEVSGNNLSNFLLIVSRLGTAGTVPPLPATCIYLFFLISLPGCYNLSTWLSAAVVALMLMTCRGSVQWRIPYLYSVSVVADWLWLLGFSWG